MTPRSSFDHHSRERARTYNTLASVFCLSDPETPRRALMELPAEDGRDPSVSQRSDHYARMLEWLESGDGTPLNEEFKALFGGDRCGKAIPRLPSCESFFADDPENLQHELAALWDSCSYVPKTLRPPCDGPGYIGHELAFVGYCLEHCEEDEALADVAERFVRDHLMRWVPLFAAALGGVSRHPAVQFVSEALQTFIGSEGNILDGAEATAY